ncbi:cell division protein FtsL [Clostridium sp. AL.422]|uniref:cell division protein FtsL n=1 Tax=Clostridium TaxID=1485 RepID=UPI00293DDFF9|nr:MULTISPECIES: cell division protein FtsL [unclassified Clostridium]MDV4150663.1 cell division protein FtsL [Clostridium sp. AL.422]
MVNKEYDYIRGNTALNPKRRYDEEKKRQVREEIERQKKEQLRKAQETKKAVVKNILQVASIALVFGVLTIARDGKVYRMQNDLSSVKSNIKTATAENEALRVNLLKLASLDEIKLVASETGMVVPQKEDTITINITKDFFADIRE